MAIFKRAKSYVNRGMDMCVQCAGLSMREIYSRFVHTGELSAVPHAGSYGNTELTAFRPDMDPSDAIELANCLYDMQVDALVNKKLPVENYPDDVQPNPKVDIIDEPVDVIKE